MALKWRELSLNKLSRRKDSAAVGKIYNTVKQINIPWLSSSTLLRVALITAVNDMQCA